MKAKLSFAALIFVCYFGANGLSASNSAFTQPCISSEKLKANFNSGISSLHNQAFTENKGQVRSFDGSAQSNVKFTFKQGNTQLFLLEKGIAYQFTRTHYPEDYRQLLSKRESAKDIKKLESLQKQIQTETFRMDMQLVGANADPVITKEGKSDDYINFYNLGALDVHDYTSITYHDVYPGIDWLIHTENSKVKYDFLVNPGADPSLIKMQFTNHEELNLNADGSFTLKNRLGSMTEEKPLSYQQGKEIPTDFNLKGNTISFAVGVYDHNVPLVIDPALVWATYYGGAGIYGESAWECATDAAGNIYLAGVTSSTTGIASGGYQNTYGGSIISDAFLVKFNSSGIRQWATYYGGTGKDEGYSCATDGSGNIYLAGITMSSVGIASGGHQNTYAGDNSGSYGDAFLVKFNTSGFRQWATYYGGNGQESTYDCATDASGNVYLSGATSSSFNIASGGHQNTIAGDQDAFLVKFDANGLRLWGTYYGGQFGTNGYSCAIDPAGNVYLAGYTYSGVGIASGGHQNTIGSINGDAFLVKFNSSGVRQWGTYYGGTNEDYGADCKTDAAGNIFLTGYTKSTTGISSGGFQNTYGGGSVDAFLVKFNGNGLRQWGTYYGGSAYDIGLDCLTDALGNIYMVGATESLTDIASGGVQNSCGGANDAFLVKFSATGIRQWGTYYGGAGNEAAYSLASDALGHIYIAGPSTSSTSIASNGFQDTLKGINDAFLAKIFDDTFTALNETKWQNNNVDVFPNPTTGIFEIRSEAPVRIVLYDEMGQLVWKNDREGRIQSVDVQGLAQGIYFVQIISGSESTVKKIIVVSD